MKELFEPPAIVRQAEDVDSLVAVVNAAHEAGQRAERDTLERFCEAGKALKKLKDAVGRGNFLNTLEDRIGISRVTAWRYMKLADNWSKCFSEKHLGLFEALKMIGEPPPDDAPESPPVATAEPEPTPEPEPPPVVAPPNPQPAPPTAPASPPVPPNKPPATTAPAAPPPPDDDRFAEPGTAPAPEPLKDDDGKPVPERLRKIFGERPLIASAINACQRAAVALRLVEEGAVHKDARDHDTGTATVRFSSNCRTAVHNLSLVRPAKVCPDCGGAHERSKDAEPCPTCTDKGYLFTEEVE